MWPYVKQKNEKTEKKVGQSFCTKDLKTAWTSQSWSSLIIVRRLTGKIGAKWTDLS